MDDSLNICLPCGFCCDGTLIGYVQLNQEELPVLKDLMDIENENNKGFFLQPCNSYCDGCTIYSNRPKQCDNFNCGLLKSVEKKKLEYDSAIEIIDEVKQQKNAIEKQLAILPYELHSKSFYFKMLELKKLLQKNSPESSVTHTSRELLSKLEQLNSLLTKNFGVSLY